MRPQAIRDLDNAPLPSDRDLFAAVADEIAGQAGRQGSRQRLSISAPSWSNRCI